MTESKGRSTRRRRNGDEPTADLLLAHAARQFRMKGFHATSMRELSAALGIEKSSLYHYLSSKDDLLYRICVESIMRIRMASEAAIAEVGDPLGRLDALILAHVESLLTDFDLHATTFFDLRSLGEPQSAAVIELRDRYEAIVRGVIADGQSAGLLTAEFTVQELGLSLLNLLNWTVFWYRPDGIDTPERIARLHRTIFLNGAGSGIGTGGLDHSF
ncbi:TetR/AcrR family transcriptional regulator [Pseudonocardia pini]|uniref:TetR/AcrR family transcriptional regulator n=1 Tax=Pseudonocardia pini TaxID=2758030 RepID=UPI0015F0E6EF|nr:TetR/AcrR family transcriptional regulator [Pseudonocardia pini]